MYAYVFIDFHVCIHTHNMDQSAKVLLVFTPSARRVEARNVNHTTQLD